MRHSWKNCWERTRWGLRGFLHRRRCGGAEKPSRVAAAAAGREDAWKGCVCCECQMPDAVAVAIAGWVNVNAKGIEGREIRPAIVFGLVSSLF